MGFKFTKEQLIGRIIKRVDIEALKKDCALVRIEKPWYGWKYAEGEKVFGWFNNVEPVLLNNDLKALVFTSSDVDDIYNGVVCTTYQTLTITNFDDESITVDGIKLQKFIHEEATEFDIDKLKMIDNKLINIKIKTNDIDYVYDINAVCAYSCVDYIILSIKSCEDYSVDDMDNLAKLLGQNRYEGTKKFGVHVNKLMSKYKLFTIEEICEGGE